MCRIVQLRLWLSIEREQQKDTENNEMIKEEKLNSYCVPLTKHILHLNIS